MSNKAYNAFVVEGEDIHSHVHLVPRLFRLGDYAHRVYGTFQPFGLKKKRCCCTINNTKSKDTMHLNGILYEENLSKDLLTHTFSDEAVWRYFSNINRRTYKSNQWLFASNANYWFSEFKVFTNFFELIHMNFSKLLQHIVYPSATYLYSSGSAAHMFS